MSPKSKFVSKILDYVRFDTLVMYVAEQQNHQPHIRTDTLHHHHHHHHHESPPQPPLHQALALPLVWRHYTVIIT